LLAGLPAGDVVADRSYDAAWVRDHVRQLGSRAHIPSLSTRKAQHSVDLAIYRARNLVERFFNKLKHFRRIATRYDKTMRNYLAAILLAAVRLWTRFESTT
jgi:transposase